MKRKRCWIVALVLVLVLTLLPSRHTARAATYTVTNTNDSGAGSLRQAIIDANNHSGDDTIEFNIPMSDPNCNAAGRSTSWASPAPTAP